MCFKRLFQGIFFISVFSFLLVGCASNGGGGFSQNTKRGYPYSNSFDQSKYVARLPTKIETHNEKVIVVDAKIFAWGAYDKNGNLVRGGMASAGGEKCPESDRSCRTSVGTFRIYSLGGENCASSVYPIPDGGALMPYCMFFHGGQSLHGSPDTIMVESNFSHGCVHLRIPDAEWIRKNFASVGTKVIIRPY